MALSLSHYISLPAVFAAGTARATATVFEKAQAPAPAPPVARKEHLGNRPAAEETSARPAARAYFEEESSAGSHEVGSPVWHIQLRNRLRALARRGDSHVIMKTPSTRSGIARTPSTQLELRKTSEKTLSQHLAREAARRKRIWRRHIWPAPGRTRPTHDRHRQCRRHGRPLLE